EAVGSTHPANRILPTNSWSEIEKFCGLQLIKLIPCSMRVVTTLKGGFLIQQPPNVSQVLKGENVFSTPKFETKPEVTGPVRPQGIENGYGGVSSRHKTRVVPALRKDSKTAHISQYTLEQVSLYVRSQVYLT
ncbi:hypothetical protein PIB30_107567, partial [Stylosanthes scabra]|nr:hypothetical protein [Stylosanthes scabra]